LLSNSDACTHELCVREAIRESIWEIVSGGTVVLRY
jgi:hypothetical protein